MGLYLISLLCFFSAYCFSAEPPQKLFSLTPNRILFLIQSGHFQEALKLYQTYASEMGHHDTELLFHIGLALLDQGYKSSDPEIQVLTIYGAGISLNEKVLYILEEGLRSSYPQIQLIAMGFLSRFQNDVADMALNRALSSNYLEIRLEGAYHLIKRKVPAAVFQAEALMSKVPVEILPLFPEIFAAAGTPEATRILRRLLSHSNEQVRVSAILSATKYARDDLLPTIRTLASQHSILQQEAAAMAFGVLKDETAVSRLKRLSQSPTLSVRLAANRALVVLGHKEHLSEVLKEAQNRDLFAIAMLGELEDGENVLCDLMNHPDIQVKVNAVLSLLKQRNPNCMIPLFHLLVRDARDLAIQTIYSKGRTLTAYKVVPSAHENLKENLIALELSLCLREEILKMAMGLPEKDFMHLAQLLFNARQNDLVPALVSALELLHTPAAIELLKKQQQKAGAPLIRNYCNLALYRLKEEGPYADNLRIWVNQQHSEELIQFRPSLPRDANHDDPYQLTPEETSRLLVESFEALTGRQDAEGINILLNAIQHGNSKNKYALTGLLMRAAL